MHLLFDTLLISLFISSYLCQNSITYVFSHVPTSTVELSLQSNGFILTNTSYVQRLLTATGAEFFNATRVFLSANDSGSIVFSWNTGDCSFPTALASAYPSTTIISPICFSDIDSSVTNLLQLTVVTKQLATAATIYMKHYTLTYFSIIISLTNSFYFNLAQEFATYLTENSFTLEQLLSTSTFTSSSLSYRSRG